jgi:hypothetical protein
VRSLSIAVASALTFTLATPVVASPAIAAAPVIAQQSGGGPLLQTDVTNRGRGTSPTQRPADNKKKPPASTPGRSTPKTSTPAKAAPPPVGQVGKGASDLNNNTRLVTVSGGPTMSPPGGSGPVCAPRDGVSFRGWNWTAVYRYQGDGANNAVIVSRSLSCSYPPVQMVSAVCAISIGGTMTGPMRNPTIASTSRNLGTEPTAFASGTRTMAACTQGYQRTFKERMTAWGHWTLAAVGTRKNCTWRKYIETGRMEFIGCSAPMRMTQSVLGTSSCQGFVVGRHVLGLRFTGDDCEGQVSTPGAWKCVTSGAPSLSGARAAEFQAFRDGAKNPGVWPAPAVSGVGNVRDKRTTLTIDKASTPMRAGVAVDGASQPFVVTPKAGTVAGWRNAWDLQWMDAGMPGRPWIAKPRWSFTGDFTTSTRTLVGIDMRTGRPIMSGPVSVTVTSSGTCDGKPIRVNVFRARNSN